MTNITSGATSTATVATYNIVATAIVSVSLLPQLLLLKHITTGANTTATTFSSAVGYYNDCYARATASNFNVNVTSQTTSTTTLLLLPLLQ